MFGKIFAIFAATPINTSPLPQPIADDPTQIILNFVFALAGSIAVLMVVINAFRYILARGDPGAVNSARNGIIYALAGLVVVMAAYSIVVFVVGRVG
ncbi:MAG TPA: hypothetical protein VMB52_07125 [Verrucomicrobiae bacterium]|nr:hypothetical protein [Verrucomicrobiae bacterium]